MNACAIRTVIVRVSAVQQVKSLQIYIVLFILFILRALEQKNKDIWLIVFILTTFKMQWDLWHKEWDLW